MKIIIDKKTVIVSGIASIFVILGYMAMSIYVGMKYCMPFTEVITAILFETNFIFVFYLVNSVLVAIFCFNLKSDKLHLKLFARAMAFSGAMLIVNLVYGIWPTNIFAVFTSVFWLLTVIYLYQNKKNSQKKEPI